MTLDVFISVDMEGIAGITTLRQTFRGTDDYVWARQLMTEEANAAIAGAFDAGADTVVVTDSHGDMGNLLPHELDPRADLVQGTPKTPFSMMTGIAEGFSLAAFIGYHAGAGTPDAVLDHTYTGFITDVRVNGETWNETHLNAALAGTFGVPVGFVAGDRACCEQAEEKLPWIRTVAVKDGFGNRVGRSRSPETARAEIRDVLREVARAPRPTRAVRPVGAVHAGGRRDQHRGRRHVCAVARDGAASAARGAVRHARRPRAVPMPADLDEPRPACGTELHDRMTSVAPRGATQSSPALR